MPSLIAMAAIPLLRKMPNWDGKLGDLSYPLYITHFIVMQACKQYAAPDIYPAVVCASIAFTALAAALFIDRPLRHLRHALDDRLCKDVLGNDGVAAGTSSARSGLARP